MKQDKKQTNNKKERNYPFLQNLKEETTEDQIDFAKGVYDLIQDLIDDGLDDEDEDYTDDSDNNDED